PRLLHLSPTHPSFFLTPPPPNPTPFPYTPLFRSRAQDRPAARGRPQGEGPAAHLARPEGQPGRGPAVPGRPPAGTGHRAGVARGDRKSTRLNSSHVKISYAVFCLKKKKKI